MATSSAPPAKDDGKKDGKSSGAPEAAKKAEKKGNELVNLVEGDIKKHAADIKKEMLGKASKELKSVMEKIPYLREVIVGGEMAKLAFEFLKS